MCMYVGLPREVTVNIKAPRDLLKVVWFTWMPSTVMFIVYSFKDCHFCIDLIIIISVLVTLRLVSLKPEINMFQFSIDL